MKIAIDVDGTLADIHTPFVRHLNMRFKKELEDLGLFPVTVKDINSYDWGAKIKALNFSPQDCVDMTDRIWREEVLSIPPTEKGLREKIGEIQSKYGSADIVTARKETEPVKRWLEYQQIPFDRFVFEEKKELLDYDVYIDDSPGLVERVPDSKTVLLYHRPWNTKVFGKKNVRKVATFDEALAEIKSISSRHEICGKN